MSDYKSQPYCTRCQVPIKCEANITSCQCNNISLTVPQRAFIAQRWSGCLCIECLSHIQLTLTDCSHTREQVRSVTAAANEVQVVTPNQRRVVGGE